MHLCLLRRRVFSWKLALQGLPVHGGGEWGLCDSDDVVSQARARTYQQGAIASVCATTLSLANIPPLGCQEVQIKQVSCERVYFRFLFAFWNWFWFRWTLAVGLGLLTLELREYWKAGTNLSQRRVFFAVRQFHEPTKCFLQWIQWLCNFMVILVRGIGPRFVASAKAHRSLDLTSTQWQATLCVTATLMRPSIPPPVKANVSRVTWSPG